MPKNITIVLVEPKGDENVGMAARAMKNCGITDLRLINPALFKTRGAYKWACSACDILENAKVFSSLKVAVDDASLVVGLSRRVGKLRPPALPFGKETATIWSRAKKGRVALVFGREDDGLDKEELTLCDFIWKIPTSHLYLSLNLAQAVLVACHEIFECLPIPTHSSPPPPFDFAQGRQGGRAREVVTMGFVSKKEIAPLLKQLSHALIRLGYDNEDGGLLRRKIVREFEKLFGRGGLLPRDINMFKGLLARIEDCIK